VFVPGISFVCSGVKLKCFALAAEKDSVAPFSYFPLPLLLLMQIKNFTQLHLFG